MHHKLMNVLAGGILLLLAAGCAEKYVNPQELTDQAALDRDIDLAIREAVENRSAELAQYWDILRPYISLTSFPDDDTAGIWMSAIVDENGEHIWSYTSEQEKYWVNYSRVAPRIEEEVKANQAALKAGERVWGSVVTTRDGVRYVFYYAPLPDNAQIERDKATHPQYLALMVVEPELHEY